MKRTTVAIVGFAPSWQQAPFADQSVEIWSLNEGHLMMPRVDRWFQMHPRWCWERNLRDAKYMEWARACEQPIYMLEAYNDIPTAVRYPLEKIGPEFRHYLTSSFSYMLALAIHEGFKEIRIFGVDLSTSEEYGYQRAGAEYLIGVAEGRGIKVVILDNCPILKSPLYGFYEPDDARLVYTQEIIEARLRELDQERIAHLARLNATEGAIMELKQWLGRVQFDERERWTRGGAPIGHTIPAPGINVGVPQPIPVGVPSDGTGVPQLVMP